MELCTSLTLPTNAQAAQATTRKNPIVSRAHTYRIIVSQSYRVCMVCEKFNKIDNRILFYPSITKAAGISCTFRTC